MKNLNTVNNKIIWKQVSKINVVRRIMSTFFKNLFVGQNIKFIISILIGSLFFSSYVYADCSYTSRDDSCEIFTSPFNSFNLNFIESSDVDSFEVSIYDSSNSKNTIRLDVDYDNKIAYNINPFTKPAVYVVDVIATNKAGKDFFYTKEFLFDNLKPNLPVIAMNLDTEQNSVEVLGTALFGSEIIVADKFGTVIKRESVLADYTFRLDLNLGNGINFFKFAVVGNNGLVSDFVERVIVSKTNAVINFKPFITVINLDDNNFLNEIVGTVTMKRNIYVSGNIGAPNSRVFISGNPVVSDEVGNFGGFVNLNSGLNTIEVLSGGITKSFSVTYVSEKFSFTNFEVQKFVSTQSVNLKIGSNFDLNFDIYLNGQFKSTQKTSNGNVEFNLNGLKYGQNYIYLAGADGEYIEKLIYYDNVKPNIIVTSSDESSQLKKFIFEVSDEFGFDISKTVFKLNSVIVSNNDLDVYGNYFVYKTENLNFGDFSYSVLVYDLAGNFKEVFGSFKIIDNSLNIDFIEVDGGAVLGNKIFFKELGNQRLTLIPSKNIAFENIYLDSEDQTNYLINRDNSIDLDVKINEESGEFEFVFIDIDRNKISQTFSYNVVMEPSIEIDFITKPILSSGETLVVSGIVHSDYFDWNSFEINSNSGKRFGNYFENHVSLESNSKLFISGSDYLGNQLSLNFAGVGVDSGNVDLQFLNEGDDFFKGSVSNFNPDILMFTNSYDGIYSKQVLSQSFGLVSAQRSGLRNLNLNGEKETLNEFEYKSTISVDGLKPEIYFFEDKIVALGTLSEVAEILVNDVIVGVGDSCNLNEFCNEIDLVESGDKVTVVDSFGNSFSRVYNGNFDSLLKDDDLIFYFTGTDKFIDYTSSFVSGQFISSEKVVTVVSSYGSCEFDEFNFVCDSQLNVGVNDVDVTIKTESGEEYSDSIEIVVLDLNLLSISLDDVYGDNVYNVLSSYYLDSNLISVLGDVSKTSNVVLVVNNEEILLGEFDSSINVIDVELGEFLAGRDEVELEIKLRAEDEFGNQEDSNVFIVMYRRVLNTIVDIVIN